MSFGGADTELACWLCERPLGATTEWHHPVPRSKKGKVKVPVHPICHRTLHDEFSNGELARIGADRSRLLENARIAKFIDWLADKSPDFHAPTKSRR